MRCPAKKAAARTADRISSLPDELLHKILSFLDTKVAVQTCTLSKRWKPVWTTLPCINIGEYKLSAPRSTYEFIRHLLINRNHDYDISELNLCTNDEHLGILVDKFVEYAILHNVKCLNLDLRDPFKLSGLSSTSLNKLTLRATYQELESDSNYWDLPALGFLHLVGPELDEYNFPGSFLTCLPALRTLCLENWKFSESLFSFCLPHLTTLHVTWCYGFPRTLNLPALSRLDWDELRLSKNICDVISKLVNLQNLNLNLVCVPDQNYILSCPQLLNLNIVVHSCHSLLAKTKFFAPKLCKFSFSGILGICLVAPEVESVNINLSDWLWNMDWIYRKRYYWQFTDLLSRLGNAKILTFDSGSIQALSEIEFLARVPPPFYNLKLVKLPNGYEESTISSDLRRYLLYRSPRATIITWPQDQVNHQAVPIPLTTNVTSVVDAGRVCQLDVSVAGTSNDRASFSRGHTDFGLWHGHEVNSEFVGLLDLIMKNYPETFEHFTAKSERFYTMKLNMLCTTVNEFLRTLKNEFNTDIISEYRDLFADMQRWGFGLDWLVSHLNYIEQLLLSLHELHATDSCRDDANNKLQELQTLCLEKVTEVQKASG